MRKNHLATYPECRACGDPEHVVVHHLRYRGKRGRSELPGDLVTLCKWHHDDLHRRLGRTPSLQAQYDYIADAAADDETFG